MLTPGALASWHAMRVTPDRARRDERTRGPPAFAADRAGFALGEAAAALVIESAAHARPAAPRGSLLAGYATNCDGIHITNPDPAGQARAMRAALAMPASRRAIGYVNAHGTGRRPATRPRPTMRGVRRAACR